MMFYSVESIRGLNGAITVIDHTTRWPWAFPVATKRPHPSIFNFLVNCLRNMGHKPAILTVDEGGELAKSTEMCRAIHKLNLVLRTTGGDNSESNGMAERPHRTYHNMNRSTLATFGSILKHPLPPHLTIEKFWCLALQHNCWIKRRIPNKTLKMTPYEKVFNKPPLYKDMHIFGSPAQVIIKQKDKLQPKTKDVYWLTYSNSLKASLYYDPHTFNINRSHHIFINDASQYVTMDSMFCEDPKDAATPPPTEVNLDITRLPFPADAITTITLRPTGLNTAWGINIKDDLDWNIPYIYTCDKDSPSWNQIPPQHRRNCFIVSINSEEPLTAAFAYELLQPRVRRSNATTTTIELQVAKRQRRTRLQLEQDRAAFDTMRPIMAPIIASHQAILPEAPPQYKHAHEAFRGPYKKHFVSAAFHQYDKNQELAVFSKPHLRETVELIKNGVIKVHKSILAPKVKRSKDVLDLYEFVLRHCFDGSKMILGLDYDESYSPTLGHESAKYTLALAAIYFMTLGAVDIKCAFQNIPSDKAIPNYCSLPHLYKEWYESRTKTKLEGEAKDYCLQVLTNFQGQKDAGRKLYQALLKLLTKENYTKSSVDHSVFTKVIDSKNFHVCISTDDFLCAYHDVKHFDATNSENTSQLPQVPAQSSTISILPSPKATTALASTKPNPSSKHSTTTLAPPIH